MRVSLLPRRVPRFFLAWFDNRAVGRPGSHPQDDRIDWLRCIPFLLLHAALGLVFVVGFHWLAATVALALYLLRMFFITGFYHRYFSHRTFKTSRAFQFAMAVAGCSAVQRDPIWWAAHHRHHHARADAPDDPHSPRQHGFLWAHMGWFLNRRNFHTRSDYVRDLERFPELRFLARFDWIVPVLLGISLWMAGAALERWSPGTGATAGQLVVWGFVVSTLACYHATYTINSLAHRFGTRRFETGDDSRNNFWLALLTMGEGWHNNHHHYPASARQGFYWWEIDLTYYLLRLLQAVGLIWDLRPVPARVLTANRIEGARRQVPA